MKIYVLALTGHIAKCRLCRKIAPVPEEKFLGKIGAYNSSVVVPQFHLESLSSSN